MDKDIHVKITYRNSKLEPVCTEVYGLQEYTGMIRQSLLRLITDIEDTLYTATGNKTQDEWPDDVWASYLHIKHKILDKAGDIGRLPDNITLEEDACRTPLG